MAIKLLINWVEGNGIKPEKPVELPRGLYLPLWTFDVGGAIDYTYEIIESENEAFGGRGQTHAARFSDQYPIMVNDLPLPASKKLSAVFLKLIDSFDTAFGAFTCERTRAMISGLSKVSPCAAARMVSNNVERSVSFS